MAWLHGAKIVHCDFKPSNLLYDRNKNCVKVCDFGLSAFLEEAKQIHMGTPHFISPVSIFIFSIFHFSFFNFLFFFFNFLLFNFFFNFSIYFLIFFSIFPFIFIFIFFRKFGKTMKIIAKKMKIIFLQEIFMLLEFPWSNLFKEKHLL